MAIHTSMISYFRGAPKGQMGNNFMYIAQANNAIVHPINSYLRNYSFYNRNIVNNNYRSRWPWSH
jgi:hypothetical protein